MLSEALRWANWHLVNAERRYDHPDECSPSTCVCGFAEFCAAATDSQSAVTVIAALLSPSKEADASPETK